MKIEIRKNCFETNSSSAHTVTYKPAAADFKYPEYICIDRANFDYCDDIVSGYQKKANYLWEIITQSSGNYGWAMKFITYCAINNIRIFFEKDWIEDGSTWYDGNLPYDNEGQELLKEYLSSENMLMKFLFNDNLIVKLYEG